MGTRMPWDSPRFPPPFRPGGQKAAHSPHGLNQLLYIFTAFFRCFAKLKISFFTAERIACRPIWVGFAAKA
jgi:hypothetical protein